MVSKPIKPSKGNVKKPTNKKVNGSVATSNSNTPQQQVTSINGNDVSMTTAEQKKLQDMLTHAQLEYAKVKHQVIKEKRREIDTLNHVIKEFMGPFILIGYDLNNNPVEMISAESTAEHDAVLERLRRVMYKINQNIANSNGNDPYGFNNN